MKSQAQSVERKSANIELIRCPDLWFHDGTVVLQANDTIYRVYSGLLAQKSSIFNGMFSLPQSDDSAEVYEGCTLVRLPDQATDLTNFLKAIYDSSFYDVDKINDFNIIAGVLRLSTKYEVQYLRQRSLKPISELYPSTLSGFDSLVSSTHHVSHFRGRQLAAAALSHECHLPTLLPCALLKSTVSIELIADGCKSTDGSHLALNSDDQRRCLLARPTLEHATRARVYSFLYSEHNGCLSESCDGFKLDFIRKFENGTKANQISNPFRARISWRNLKKCICNPCYDDALTSYNRERAALWDELPGIFGLDTWDELKKMQSE